ncbi:MAG TPA: alpha/beta fold hydrolase [Candidatus Dormibacteraeota bacterium]|nr:alpha/beta fold hydrolase [Candidatus Dormibacteraeota bacterium]
MNPFEPHRSLRNKHIMTVAATYWRRNFPHLPLGIDRFFEVEPGTKLLGHCHWQAEPKEHATIVLVHGLEGSSDSGYMLGIAEKAYRVGFNAIRLNQRNCGGSEKLTATLYNSGLSGDYHAVLHELITRDALPDLFFCGYSMGGNLVLKMAGELGAAAPRQLRGVAAVCPSLDLAACADALELPTNFFYHRHFVVGLKRRYRRKAQQLPETYSLAGLARIRSLRQFDNIITAPRSGYRDAVDYYDRASAIRVAGQIRVPTLIITAKDDPFVPVNSFTDPAITGNRNIQLVTTEHGGHCAFVSRTNGPERFWAEARVVEFCRKQLR